jgi:hypothetical protein
LILRETVIESIIKLPEETFLPFGSSASTSILLLRKKTKGISQNLVTMAIARGVGYDRNGSPTRNNDLLTIRRKIADLDARGEKENEGIVLSAPTVFLVNHSSLQTRMDVPALVPTEANIGGALRRSIRFASLNEFVQIQTGALDPADCPDGIFQYIGLAQVENFTGSYRVEKLEGRAIRSRCFRFRKGDILFGRLRPNLRKVALVDSIENGICSTEFYVMRPKDPSMGRLIAALLRSDLVFLQYSHLVTGIGRPRISKPVILGIRLPRNEEDLARLGRLALESQENAMRVNVEAEQLMQKAEQDLNRRNADLVKDVLAMAAKP